MYQSAALLLMIGLALPNAMSAEEPAKPDQHLTYLVKRQQAHQLTRKEDRVSCSLRTEPIIRWVNPISGANGGVFLWTIDDRPAAISKCHINDRKKHYVESTVVLAPNLVLTHPNRSTWMPQQPDFKEIAVNETPRLKLPATGRLIEMRKLAEEFTITDRWGEDEGELYQLRLMPRPLYRYSSESAGVIDGAIFGFAQGTNPEAIVIVEVIRQNGSLSFRCGISRLTGYELQATRGGATVFEVARVNGPGIHDGYRHHWEKPMPYPIAFDETK
ncbi:hypothetical protein LOC67_00925 [Stieleria sp. JC731]|uniref:hypothetical protein n=1 Tax=Pirellulaceae TaxID=2691357 RepID=UPI001E53B268|nr:hypothetical protein [Stieleria sp. JC731]MCC9599103.1 hypothetical protein [Stieleria sp. JC731]